MRFLAAATIAAALTAAALPAVAFGAPPAGVTGAAFDGQVQLAWQPAAGASSYNVYRGTSPTALTQIQTGVLTTFATDAAATNGTTYYYAVRAVIGGVESTDSVVVQSTPRARGCSSGNETVLENCYPGDSSWALANPTNTSGIDGFATASSINKGESLNLKIDTDGAASYRIEIDRSGYYNNVQARLYSTITGFSSTGQSSCTTDAATGLVDCSNWTTSATITTTPSWPSGVYIARLVRSDNNADNHVIFVVRDDARHSDILFGPAFTTYQAYNNYGGKSLYDFNSSGATTVAGTPRAVKVSFDRPYAQGRPGDHNWYTRADAPLVSWLEEQGYDTAYQSDSDMERNGVRVRDHRVYMLAAHDEYYSSAMRSALESARDAGVNLFSPGANQVYWKIRFEDGPNGGQDRVEVNYKSTQSGGPDPSAIPTGTWRDPAGANRPENALLGSMYVGDNTSQSFPLVVSEAQGKDQIYRGTSLATQTVGSSTSVGTDIVGWEWDARVANGSEPAGVTTLAASPVTGSLIQNNGANSTPGSTVVNAVKYKAASGAWVFAAGTNQWTHGLAATVYSSAAPDVRIAQPTVNILTDMGVAPTTLSSELTVIPTPPGGGGGGGGSGGTPPTVTEKIPADEATNVSTATTVRAIFSKDMNASTINNTTFTLAPAAGGANVAATVTYDAATRTATLTPTSALDMGTQYRASLSSTIADTGSPVENLAVTSWTFTTISCPCTLFVDTLQPVTQEHPTQDGRSGPGPWSYELGVQVTVDQPMQLNALRFWKSPSETGIHTGKIWNASGTILAQAEFALETASGWQQQPLANPITLQPGQIYTISYNANNYFGFTTGGLTSQVNSGPLHTVVGGNGVFGASAGTFPTGSFNNANYFADGRVAVTTTPVRPSVTAVTPRSLSTNASTTAAVTATFSTAMNPITGSTFTLTGPGGPVAATVTYNATTRTASLTPNAVLASGTTYTATVAQSAQSTAGQTLESAAVWSFTTTSNCVCTLFSPTSSPTNLNLPTQDGRVGPGPWSYELGTKFTVDTTTSLTALRFWKTPLETGSHTLKLWANGAPVTSAVAVTESASGWQHQALATPITLQPGVNYVVSYNANDYFASTPTGLGTQISSGPLRSVVGLNGVYGESAGVFPTNSFNNTNYFADVQVADPPLQPPPAPTDASPRGGATGVATASNVRVTFSRAMDAATINGTNFTLVKQGGGQVAATVSYNAATLTATLTPNAPLEQGATYTATLTTAIHASDGTPLANTIAWSFSTADTVPPDTTLTSNPTNPTNATTAGFTFTSNDTSATFECALNTAAFTTCTSPQNLTGLADGSHTFQVRAKDHSNNVDPTPASFTWTVDTVAPDTTITSGPSNPSSSTSATFTFTSSEPTGAMFRCSLDGGAPVLCVNGVTYNSLSQGPHTFTVAATDAAGNADASAASSTWTVNVDTTPPDTSISASPANPSNTTSASFSFTSTETGSTFQCSLDGGAFATCTSPQSYTGLAQGSHTFQVKATDAASNTDTTAASFTWTVDSIAPDTTIASGPGATSTSSSATFTFTSEVGATFQCSLDGIPFAACTSPQTYTGLANGSHTFQVRALDAAGNVDGSPASHTWTINVDTTPPNTSITASPSNPAASTSASFSFTSTETGSTFQCSLDGAAFTTCSSPQAYTGLAQGSHTFQVRATDEAGNTDTTPASFTWVVDTLAPDTTIGSSPANPSTSSSASFSFTASETPSTFQCSLDGAAFATCTSPQNYTGLSNASHTFQVRATDAAGNTDATPASYTWTVNVDTTPPDTSITTSPSNPATSTSASFSFTSTETGSTFQCALDTPTFTACTSLQNYTGLAQGSHTFQVKATDAAGNTDGTAASYTWTVDTMAPDTTISSQPANPSTSSSASFSFTSTETPSAFQCSLDGAAFASCTSPQNYTGLSNASHTFQVRATDAAGNTDGSPASYTWTVNVDTTAPNTSITASPSNPATSTSASFSFTSTETPSTFECRLDGAAFATCTSPQNYTGLALGSHTFEVRATDGAGNTDATPASFTWTVDTVAPDTTISSQPANPSTSASASFSFTSTETPSTFQCSLDGAAFATCTSPQNYTGLSNASHTFQVKATDAAGNTDASAASYTWTVNVDTTAPDTSITANPTNPTTSTSASFSFTSTESPSTFECRLDGAAFATCTSPQAYSSLATGSHTFDVRATDAAGNTDATPASYTWTIQVPAGFAVNTTSPTDGETEVAPSSGPSGPKVTATFTQAVDPTTITTATFKLLRPDNSQVPATPSYTAATMTANLVPTLPLAYSTTYRVVATTGIKSSTGTPLAADKQWTFTTTGAGKTTRVDSGSSTPYTSGGVTWDADTTAYSRGGTTRTTTNAISGTTDPALYQTERNGAFIYTIGVPNGTYDIKLHFAETLKTGAGQRVFGIDLTDTATPNPDINNLDVLVAAGGANKAYVATLSNIAITDGTVSLAAKTITDVPFIDAIEVLPVAPTVTAKTPAVGATGVGTGAKPTATFSRAMNAATITSSSFTLKRPDGSQVAATVTYDSATRVATLTPSAPLVAGTTYTVRLEGTITGADGMAIAPVSWTFTA